MSTGEPGTSSDPVSEFAVAKLGPVSARYLDGATVRAAVNELIDRGTDLEDAVLAQIHGAMSDSPRMADEFAAYFMLDLMKMGRQSMSSSSRLRRFLDTGDLVVSVFGDLWSDLAALRFESRHQFKTLFAQRMRWKATDKARRLGSQRRREDRRVPQQPEEIDDLTTADTDCTPLSQSIRQEEKEHLILILLRLKERDRRLLALHLKGDSIDSIAGKLDMSYEAARKALSRAIDQARRLAAADERAAKMNQQAQA